MFERTTVSEFLQEPKQEQGSTQSAGFAVFPGALCFFLARERRQPGLRPSRNQKTLRQAQDNRKIEYVRTYRLK